MIRILAWLDLSDVPSWDASVWPLFEAFVAGRFFFRSRAIILAENPAPVSFIEREDPIPVLLHVHYRPTFRVGVVERLVELADGRCGS